MRLQSVSSRSCEVVVSGKGGREGAATPSLAGASPAGWSVVAVAVLGGRRQEEEAVGQRRGRADQPAPP
jgi:hypothetical protein